LRRAKTIFRFIKWDFFPLIFCNFWDIFKSYLQCFFKIILLTNDKWIRYNKIEEKAMRLDKFLKVSRVIKRITVANEAADMGRIAVNRKNGETKL